jgi:hypothetical protein
VVQYAFTFLADLVMQNPSMMIGGIAAGSVPPNDVVTDPDGPVFPVNPGTTGPFSGSVFLNLSTGRFTASWTIQQTTSSITGYVRCAETPARRLAIGSCSSSRKMTQASSC